MRDERAEAKRLRAIEWVSALDRARALVISLQVVNEFARFFVDKRVSIGAAEIAAAVRGIAGWPMAPFDSDVSLAALAIRERWKFAWWDCLIVAAAMAAECDYILSEDLQDGLRIGRMAIVSPFTAAPSAYPSLS